jgi:DNA-binding XRE family transcriptional regulator
MESGEIRAFGEALGIFRTRANLTQQKLADLLGMSRRSIAASGGGENLPKAKWIVLQISAHEIKRFTRM